MSWWDTVFFMCYMAVIGRDSPPPRCSLAGFGVRGPRPKRVGVEGGPFFFFFFFMARVGCLTNWCTKWHALAQHGGCGSLPVRKKEEDGEEDKNARGQKIWRCANEARAVAVPAVGSDGSVLNTKRSCHFWSFCFFVYFCVIVWSAYSLFGSVRFGSVPFRSDLLFSILPLSVLFCALPQHGIIMGGCCCCCSCCFGWCVHTQPVLV